MGKWYQRLIAIGAAVGAAGVIGLAGILGCSGVEQNADEGLNTAPNTSYNKCSQSIDTEVTEFLVEKNIEDLGRCMFFVGLYHNGMRSCMKEKGQNNEGCGFYLGERRISNSEATFICMAGLTPWEEGYVSDAVNTKRPEEMIFMKYNCEK